MTDRPSTAVSKARLRLWLRLLKASRLIENELRDRLRLEFETTLPRFDVLAALARNASGLTMTALSHELKVSNGNVTGIVDRLVAEGAIERVAVAGDRRATLVRLTSAGNADFATMARTHEVWIDELLGRLSRSDIEALMLLLHPVIAVADTAKNSSKSGKDQGSKSSNNAATAPRQKEPT